MDKAELMELIAKINTKDEQFTVSSETTSWKACREVLRYYLIQEDEKAYKFIMPILPCRASANRRIFPFWRDFSKAAARI